MKNLVALGIALLLMTGTAFAADATKMPTCDQFPSGLDRIAKAPSIAEIDQVMIDFGWDRKIGEEGLKEYFGGELENARAAASNSMSQKQRMLCPATP